MKKIGVIFLLAFLVIGSFLLWWKTGVAPVNIQSNEKKVFVVAKGAGLRAIANNLKEEGLIKDSVLFFLLVKKLNLDKKIQAGDFLLSPSMNAGQIANALTQSSLDIWVTITEGKRADEIADILKVKIPTYDEKWRALLNQNEGYLFPDTYRIAKDATIEKVTGQLRGTFDQKYQTVKTSPKLSQEETVIIASLIEREARHDTDRPLVSSVIHNRLDLGMKLDIDATIQYALGYQPLENTWWKRHLSLDDLALNSPYNTYRVAGLPPTPIANPGIKSLEAAANPATTNYLYYLSDSNGTNHYSKTLEEQEANKKKYL